MTRVCCSLQVEPGRLPRRILTPIHNRTIQTVAKIMNGQSGKTDPMKFNMSKPRNTIGNMEVIITKNASIPRCSSLIGRVNRPIAPSTEATGKPTNTSIINTSIISAENTV